MWAWRSTGNMSSTRSLRLRCIMCCTGKIEFFLTVIPKIIGPVMLKKTANDRTDRNIFRQPFDSRTQATDPADNQIDFDASVGEAS